MSGGPLYAEGMQSFAKDEDMTTFQALLSSELPGSSCIPSLVRDLCLGEKYAFTAVETLRLENLARPIATVPAVENAVTVLASKVAHLHLHWSETGYGQVKSDLIDILSPSPRRSSFHLSSYNAQGTVVEWTERQWKPIYKKVRIGKLVANLYSFKIFYVAMWQVYALRWPFAVIVDRLTLTNHTLERLGFQSEFSLLAGYLYDTKWGLQGLKKRLVIDVRDDSAVPTTTLNIKCVDVDAPSILQSKTSVSECLTAFLRWRMLLTPRMRFLLGELEPEKAVPEQCAGLDGALASLAAEDPELKITFNAQCPAERLVDWVETMSACFPTLTASGTRVGMVCSANGSPGGEPSPAVEHWWS
ncbi:uncharacterized protein B0H18DRAFT_1118311 [Fomitopsis serialis]|uniref:uncharacterized protein n=1 Tax=Fomitopsis serialis TaxID=139415 RepID=UPI0020077551|nr:uncharacterized protein B0H18DRAFT_1118311 [Neoantrodia serialis]KAH9927782.1 hypothetical protein B0H18DRAFT_1118311 [Neoantrodia serialis]